MLAQRLKTGDLIGIISPSHVAVEETYAPIFAALQAAGFRVRAGKNLFRAPTAIWRPIRSARTT